MLCNEKWKHNSKWSSMQILHISLEWRHNGHYSVSNHQPHDCLLNRLFRRRSKKTSMRRVTGLCVGNSPVPGEFPAQMASNAENVSIWWRHHGNREEGQEIQRHRDALNSSSESKLAIARSCTYCIFIWFSWLGSSQDSHFGSQNLTFKCFIQ